MVASCWLLVPAIYFLLIFNRLQAQGKDIFVSRLTEQDGLSPGGVMNFFQDAEGALWICTIAGLNRYDGAGITSFISNPIEVNSLSTTAIHDITQDPSGILWIATRGGGLNAFDPLTGQFTHYRHDPEDPTSIAGNNMEYLDIDDEGQLWIGSETGLTRFDPATGKARQFYPSPGKPGRLQGNCRGEIIADSLRIYLGTSAGFEYYDRRSGQFRFFPLVRPESGDTFRYQVYGMALDRQGKVWFGYSGEGLRMYDPVADNVTHVEIQTKAGRRNARPMRMLEDQRGYLWIAGFSEIWRVSPDRKQMEQLNARSIDTHDLLSGGLWSIFEDRSGLIWFGSPNRMALYFDPRREVFQFHGLPTGTGPAEPTVNCIWQDRQDIIWFGVGRALCRYDPKTGEQTAYPQTHIITNLSADPQGLIWLATEGGLFRFDPATRQSVPVLTTQTAGRRLETVVYTAFDRDGDLWVSTWDYGLYRIRRETLSRTDLAAPLNFDRWSGDRGQSNPLPTLGLQKITADSKGHIWACGNMGGVTRIEIATGRVRAFGYRQGATGSISNNYTYSVAEGPDGGIWVSTNGGGLNRFDPDTENFVHYTTRDGLLSNVVFDLVFDGQGLLWLNTLKGISCFDPATETFTHFNEKDGLQCWTEDLHYNPQTNTIFAAGAKGFNAFSPEEVLQLKKTATPVALTAVFRFDPKQKQLIGLPKVAWANGRLEVSHRESPLRLEFSVLDFRNPTRHRYRYSLTKSGDPEWVDLHEQNQVDLARLDPGAYQFLVEGCNSDGLWSRLAKPLTIVIRPPFWRTGWAYSLYALLGTAIFIFLYRFDLRRRLAIRETQQARELNKLKTRLYTNITHEFRTPLTVILGMTDAPSDTSKAMRLIRRNAEKLLHLINQLLDLSRLDNNNLQPRYQQMEMVSFTRYIGESFQSLAEKIQLQLTVDSAIDQCWMDMDEELYRQIVSNLLSNAVKFTPQGGRISVNLAQKDHRLALQIRDNGIGIPQEALPYIFDRFYQVDQVESRRGKGTGIGLALVKELVQLLDGEIRAESEPGYGSVFTVYFPIRRNAGKKTETFEPLLIDPTIAEPFEMGPDAGDAELPGLLIIEDNPDVVFYIQSILQSNYHIQVAPNGAAGIEKAIETIPDIIISDVMMPEKDGFEVVETLKQDERTSHIPIILLTAKATQEDRIAGLKSGADAYLMKPFDKTELFVRLEKLVELRRSLQARYAQAVQPVFTYSLPQDADPAAAPSPDDLFLQKIRRIIDERIGDVDLDISFLCQKVGLSATQLFRKMKALTGEAPISFIRRVRLHRGRELLQTTDLTIAEIAYDLGFTDPGYFSRAFGKEFGSPPSDNRK